MNNINEIYKMLSWHSSFGEQLKGIKLVRNSDDSSPFILPCTNEVSKEVWGNCARALIILDRLKVFSGKKLKTPFIEHFTYADQLNNEEGFMWLDYLSELLDNEELKKELPKPILEKLQKHYKNWGFWS